MAATTWLWCSTCAADAAFEVPPCADDHGAECPDLACTGCGAAVWGALAPLEVELPLAPARAA